MYFLFYVWLNKGIKKKKKKNDDRVWDNLTDAEAKGGVPQVAIAFYITGAGVVYLVFPEVKEVLVVVKVHQTPTVVYCVAGVFLIVPTHFGLTYVSAVTHHRPTAYVWEGNKI